MKTYAILFAFVLAFSAQSCLPLVEDFQYIPTPKDGNMKMSAWSFITQRADFADFKTIIIASGIDTLLYAQTDKKYTYLLLNQAAVASLLKDKFANSTVATVGALTNEQKLDLKNRLLYHIVDGYYYGLPGGNLCFEPVQVNTLWKDSLSVMALKLDKDPSLTKSGLNDGLLGVNSYKPVADASFRAVTSNLFVTNGVMAVLGRYASYDLISR
jgi:hypothetical protein